MLRCRSLEIRSRDRVIVKDFDLEAREGEIVLIAGSSGSGKSMVLKTLAGITQLLYRGIEVRGNIKIFGLKPEEALYRSLTMYVPQDLEFAFLGRNLREELEILRTEIDPLIVDELELRRYIDRDPQELSAGERYRLILALALHLGVHIIFVDEPSTYLDRETLHKVFKLLREYSLKKGLIVVVADHRIDMLRVYVDKVYYLESTTCCTIDRLPEPRSVGSITARDVWFRYSRRSQWIVRGLDIDIGAGDVVGFVGRNGSGKTTILRLMSGFLKPTRGIVHRKGTAFYIPQHVVYWFTRSSVIDELRRLNIDERILKLAGLYDKRALDPHTLSVGEARRLSIYMAFYSGRSVVFIDEISLGLDTESMRCVRELIEEASCRGIATVFTTHDREIASEMKCKVVNLE